MAKKVKEENPYKDLLEEVLEEIKLGSRAHENLWDHWVSKIENKIKLIEGEDAK